MCGTTRPEAGHANQIDPDCMRQMIPNFQAFYLVVLANPIEFGLATTNKEKHRAMTGSDVVRQLLLICCL